MSLLLILQSLQFILFCVKKMILYQIVARSSKRLFLSMTLCTSLLKRTSKTYEEFDCGITFYPKIPTKIRQTNRERNYISRPCEKSKCIPSNDRHNRFFHGQQNSSILLKRYILWDMDTAALMSLNHTNDRYSLSNQSPQQTTHQHRTNSYPVFSSLRRMDSQTKGLHSTSVLHSYNEITYQADEWTKQLQRLKSWVISGNPEQWMEFRRLWWTVIVFKCSYLFHLFDFCCLAGAKIVVSLENLPFLFPFFDDFEWAVKINRHFLCKVTLL